MGQEQKNGHVIIQEVSIGQVLLNAMKYVGFLVLALVPIRIVPILMRMQDQFSIVVNSILGVTGLAVIISILMFLWNRYYKYSKEKIQKIEWRDIGFALLFFLITRVIAVVGTLLLALIYGDEMSANDEVILSIGDNNTFTLYFFLFVFSLGILVPIVEELVYRGIGTNLLFKKQTFWLPLIVTSSIFGLIHIPENIVSFLVYGFMGVVYFLSYYRRKNILDSMLVHILNNGVIAIFLAISYIMDFM